MSLKKLGMTLLAVFALGAIAANGANAANEFNAEVGSAWYTGASPGTRLAEGETKAVTGELGSEKLTLETTIGGASFDLTWKVWELTESVLRNEKLATRWSATTSDRWTLIGGIFTLPIACSVPEKITTNPLKGTVAMKTGSSTVATVKFVPESGTTIATVEVTGKECAIAGTYKLTGAVYGEASSATGVFGSTQSVKFSKAIQESAGEAKSLKIGENAAFLTGTLKTSIGGTEFATKEE
jgi:hypothetical protein